MIEERKKRTRLSADVARERILEAGVERFIEGGVEAVKVQVIAKDLGITDATIHHHFGNRQGLLEAMLRRAGRRLADRMRDFTEACTESRPNVSEFVELISTVYEEEGYAYLALRLSLSGWKSSNGGIFQPFGEALHDIRCAIAVRNEEDAPELSDTLHILMLLHTGLLTEALFGGEIRRSVGIPDTFANKRRYRQWLVRFFEEAFVGQQPVESELTVLALGARAEA